MSEQRGDWAGDREIAPSTSSPSSSAAVSGRAGPGRAELRRSTTASAAELSVDRLAAVVADDDDDDAPSAPR